MISKEDIKRVLLKYGKNPAISTICSHSALQIFSGAKEEGFRTIGVCTRERLSTYKAFPHAKPDEFLIVEHPSDILNEALQKKLLKKRAILIPHGSFVEYIGSEQIKERLKIPVFGNRKVLEWEEDREKSRKWLEETAGLHMPKNVSKSRIDRLCIVKFDGAKGGRGYFLVSDSREFEKIIHKKITEGEISEKASRSVSVQEYITGVRYYFHYFYTPLSQDGFPAGEGSIELLGIDRRDESNIDELHRTGMSYRELLHYGVTPSYTVTGNQPAVLRESLLPDALSEAKKVVEASISLFPPGIIGPFCLETVCTPDLKLVTFEVSARIVAGTNIYADGSPYSYLLFGSRMSMGRRIAKEIKRALEKGMLDKIIY